jgi:hypothetical protein
LEVKLESGGRVSARVRHSLRLSMDKTKNG